MVQNFNPYIAKPGIELCLSAVRELKGVFINEYYSGNYITKFEEKKYANLHNLFRYVIQR